MYKFVKTIIILAIFCLLLNSNVIAAVPHLVRYQGYLTDSQNSPLNGSYNLTFRIYNTAAAGGLLWNETQSGVQVTNGSFTVLLGQITPLDLTFDSDCWISIEVNSDGEMAPRQRITSVPTAYHAENSENAQNASKFDNKESSNFVLTVTDQLIQGIKTFGSIPTLPSDNPTNDNQAVRKAYVDSIKNYVDSALPSGTIIFFAGSSCPTGYSRLTALDGKFLVGGENFNPTAGGNNTHNHGVGSYSSQNHSHNAGSYNLPTTGNHTLTLAEMPSHQHGMYKTAGYAGSGIYTGETVFVDNMELVATIRGENKVSTYEGGGQSHTHPGGSIIGNSGSTGATAISGTSDSADSRPEFATILCCQKN
jgi:hypothetical protein